MVPQGPGREAMVMGRVISLLFGVLLRPGKGHREVLLRPNSFRDLTPRHPCDATEYAVSTRIGLRGTPLSDSGVSQTRQGVGESHLAPIAGKKLVWFAVGRAYSSEAKDREGMKGADKVLPLGDLSSTTICDPSVPCC